MRSGRFAVRCIFASKSLSNHSFKTAAAAATKEVPNKVKTVRHISIRPAEPQYKPTRVVRMTRRLRRALASSDQS